MPNRRSSGIGSTSAELCFVLMPFKPALDATYENAIKPAVTADGYFSCRRADEIYGPRPIMADVWRSINVAKLVVADLTDRNPNVLYELGLSHAIQKPVMLLCQQMEDIPFDLRAIRCIQYHNNRAGRDVLREQLRRAMSEFVRDMRAEESPSRLHDYVILSPIQSHRMNTEPNESIDDEQRRLTEALRNGEPSVQFAALSALVDPTATKFPHHFRSNLISLVVEHVHSDRPEMRLAAVRFLSRFGKRHHLHLVYPLLESKDPDIVQAVIQMISAHRATESEEFLLRMIERMPLSLRSDVIGALARVGGNRTVKRLTAILQEGVAVSLQSSIVKTLCELQPRFTPEFVRLVDITQLTLEARAMLAVGLRQDDEGDISRRRLDEQAAAIVRALAHDDEPEVRGEALLTWYVLTARNGNHPNLSREEGWSILEKQDDYVLDTFFSHIIMVEKQIVFMPYETSRLVQLAKSHPFIEDHLVFYFHKHGGTEVAEYMVSCLDLKNSERLWAFAYFARCPSEVARQPCMEEMADGESLNTAVLAAGCLAKLGDEKARNFVYRNRKKKAVYSWVEELIALPTRRNSHL